MTSSHGPRSLCEAPKTPTPSWNLKLGVTDQPAADRGVRDALSNTEISIPIPIHPSTYSFWAFKPVYTKAFRPVSGDMCLHSLPLHPFHMVDQTNRGATCMYVYMYVCICDAVFWWIIAPRSEGLCRGFLSSCSPPKIRQHCSLSICKHLINTEANKKKINLMMRQAGLST